MSILPLDELLALIGTLNDAPGHDTPREQFRRYLRQRLSELADLRAYVRDCRRTWDEQHVRALQDLVVHLGRFLDFEVAFAPYQWLPGKLGFAGTWTTPSGLHIVLEMKTEESYVHRRPTLARTIEQLIYENAVPSWSSALGLYVIGRADLSLTHLERAILDEKQAHELRIISLDSLLRLAELRCSGALTPQEVLRVFRAARPDSDPLIDLVARLSTQPDSGDIWKTMENNLGRIVEDIRDAVEQIGDFLFGRDCDDPPTDDASL